MPVTLIPGDGVGPEIMDSTKEVLTRMGAKVHIYDVGWFTCDQVLAQVTRVSVSEWRKLEESHRADHSLLMTMFDI